LPAAASRARHDSSTRPLKASSRMLHPHRKAVCRRAQQAAQAPPERDPAGTRLAHRRARRLVAEKEICLVALVQHLMSP
jgi:hypothetical protein